MFWVSGIQGQRLRKHPGEDSTKMDMFICGTRKEYSLLLRGRNGTNVSGFSKCCDFDTVNEMSKEKKNLYCELIFVLPRKFSNKWLRMIEQQYYLESMKKLSKSLQNSLDSGMKS